MVSKTGEAESITSHYLFALGSYRGLYILNWIYRSIVASVDHNLDIFSPDDIFPGIKVAVFRIYQFRLNTDPDSVLDLDPIRIQEFDDKKLQLKKKFDIF